MAIPLASFTVNDGASTPVAQTFSIIDRTSLSSVYRNSAATLVAGSQQFTHKVVLAKAKNAANRAELRLDYPVEGTLDGVVQVLRYGTLSATINFSQGSSEAERSTALGLFLNILAQADVKAATAKLISLG